METAQDSTQGVATRSIAICGPIAAGKTTFAKYLAAYTPPNFGIPAFVVAEPVDMEALTDMYTGKSAVSEFQYAFLNAYESVAEYIGAKNYTGDSVAILDGSIFDCVMYNKTREVCGDITTDELEALQAHAAEILERQPLTRPSEVLYFPPPPLEEQRARIQRRGRECEQGLLAPGNTFLETLNEVYATQFAPLLECYDITCYQMPLLPYSPAGQSGLTAYLRGVLSQLN